MWKNIYTDEQIKIIQEFIDKLYHVKEGEAANDFTVALRYKEFNKEKCRTEYVEEYHKLSYLHNFDNAKRIFNKLGKCNVQISLNQFSTKSSFMKNLVSVNAIEISIDYHSNYDYEYEEPEMFIQYLQENVFRYTPLDIKEGKDKFNDMYIATPNIIEVTNRIRLIWLIDRCRISKDRTNNKNIKKFIRAIKSKMESVFETHRCTICYRQNMNGFIHFPFSYKSKFIFNYGIYMDFDVRYLFNFEETYKLQDIADKFISREELNKAKTRLTSNVENKRIKGIAPIHNIINYNKARIRDIKRLFEIRSLNIGNITNKEISFQLAVHLKLLHYKYNDILAYIIKVFRCKKEDVTIEDIKSYIKGIRQYNYKFYADDIAFRFGLSEAECKEYNLTTFILSYGSKKRKKDYDKERYITYKKTTNKVIKHLTDDDKKEIIRLFRDDKISAIELADKYIVSKTTIYEIVKDVVANNKKLNNRVFECALDLMDMGYTIKRISTMFNVNYDALRKKIYRHNKNC